MATKVTNMQRIDMKVYKPKHTVPAKRGYRSLLAVMALTLCACQSPFGVESSDRERIRAQRSIWDAQQISDYTFESRRLCFCGFVGWLEVTVEADTLRSVVAIDDVEAPAWAIQDYPTVDGLFDILVDAVERDAAQIDVTWHETQGYPTTFFIDYSRNTADEELGHDVRILTPAA